MFPFQNKFLYFRFWFRPFVRLDKTNFETLYIYIFHFQNKFLYFRFWFRPFVRLDKTNFETLYIYKYIYFIFKTKSSISGFDFDLSYIWIKQILRRYEYINIYIFHFQNKILYFRFWFRPFVRLDKTNFETLYIYFIFKTTSSFLVLISISPTFLTKQVSGRLSTSRTQQNPHF